MATDAGRESQLSEAQIAVHWREEELYQPPASIVAQANAADPPIFERFSEEHFPECLMGYAALLSCHKRWDTILGASRAALLKWFGRGRLNASYNCVDRQ